MRRLLVILAVVGLIVGVAGVAAASPVTPLGSRTITPQYCCVVEPV